jgi:hypothetical protein
LTITEKPKKVNETKLQPTKTTRSRTVGADRDQLRVPKETYYRGKRVLLSRSTPSSKQRTTLRVTTHTHTHTHTHLAAYMYGGMCVCMHACVSVSVSVSVSVYICILIVAGILVGGFSPVAG